MPEVAAPGMGAPDETRVVSLYRLADQLPLDECWARPADDADVTFESVPVDLGDEALLVHGRRDAAPIEWTRMIEGLTGHPLEYESSEASAVVFVRVDRHTYALTFGGGWRLLHGGAIDRDFGLAFALRALDSEDIRRIRRLYFSAKSRVDTNVVPGGQALWSFGIREHAELVRQIVGKVRPTSRFTLSHLRKTARRGNAGVSIDCADRIRIPLPSAPTHLVADLREITRVLTGYSVDPALAPLTFIRRISTQESAILDSAWAQLYECIRRYDDAVSLAYPDRYHGGPEIATFAGRIGRYHFDKPDLSIDDIRAGIDGRDIVTFLSTLKNGRINGYDEAGNTLGGDVAALHWISAQVDLPNGRRLILLDGDWYELTDRYRHFVSRLVGDAFARKPSWTLPAWNNAPIGEDTRREEKHYNAYAGTIDGFLCLDRKLVYTRMHRHGFEACDLLGPNQELIHVKRVSSRTGSGPLSHLFAQGIVSAENLTDRETWDQFVEKVKSQDPERAAKLGGRPRSIVYAIHKSDGPLRPDTLFTFAQSELASAAMILEKLGIPLQILAIP